MVWACDEVIGNKNSKNGYENERLRIRKRGRPK
jgi:hypothetical protein